jgi:hypothetical protein
MEPPHEKVLTVCVNPEGKAFEATFKELKKDWEKNLRLAHKAKQSQRDIAYQGRGGEDMT